ncbi:hypothetical protein TWF281_009527 [Arthrobotrys megalospora]
MVLSEGFGQQWLHHWSKKAVSHQKAVANTQTSSNPENLYIPQFLVSGQFPSSFKKPRIPNPSLFDFKAVTSEDLFRLPTVAECATHLEILAAFYQLRQGVLSSTELDEVLGIKSEDRGECRRERVPDSRRGISLFGGRYQTKEVKVEDETFQKRRKTKWEFYKSLAVVRFTYWANAVTESMANPLAKGVNMPLPPIDVLMVVYVVLLGLPGAGVPRDDDGNATGNKPEGNAAMTYSTAINGFAFPWSRIHDAINSNESDWQSDIDWFEANVGMKFDLFEYLVSERKSYEIKMLLKKHGLARGVSSSVKNTTASHNSERGIRIEEVNWALKNTGGTTSMDINFLTSCQSALKKGEAFEELCRGLDIHAAFVDNIERQLWIRSPCAAGTLSRAIDRYKNFCQLKTLYPGYSDVLVPTLDIRLVWYTHLASSRQHLEPASLISHNIGSNDYTRAGFTKTNELYQIRFSQSYRICTCWDCEALRSAAEISEPDSEDSETGSLMAQSILDEVAYYRAVEIARRKGQSLLPVQISK